MAAWLLPAAIGAGLAGGVMGAGDSAKRALETARARNAVLSDTLGRIDANAAENRGTFDTRMQDYAPGAQPAALGAAQDTRAGNNVANITSNDPNAIGLSGSAPSAVRGAIAQRMLEAYEGSKARGTASGNLGGYGDAWMGNKIGIADSASRIGTVNNFSQGQARILPALQDYAEQAAYRPPALLPQILKFAGNVVGSAAGSQMFGTPGAAAAGGINPGVAGGGYLGAGGQLFPGPGAY